MDEKLAARDERCSSERRPWEKKGCADGGGIDSECSRTRNLARVSCRCVSCLLELMKRETREAAEKPPRWGATGKPPASVLALIQSSSEVFIFMCVFRFELQYAVSAFGAVRWAQAVPPSMGRRGQRVGTRGWAPSRLPPFAYDSTIVTPSLMQGVWTVSQRGLRVYTKVDPFITMTSKPLKRARTAHSSCPCYLRQCCWSCSVVSPLEPAPPKGQMFWCVVLEKTEQRRSAVPQEAANGQSVCIESLLFVNTLTYVCIHTPRPWHDKGAGAPGLKRVLYRIGRSFASVALTSC